MTNRTVVLGGVALAVSALAGCYTASLPEPDSTGAGAVPHATATEPTQPAPVAQTKAADTGLPCDVASLLADSCSSCHGAKLRSGAPNHLVTRADLLAPTPSDRTHTAAQESLLRMKDGVSSMPPDGRLPAAKIAAFEAWVDAKMPPGSCTAAAAGDAAGAPTNGGTTGGFGNFQAGETPLHLDPNDDDTTNGVRGSHGPLAVP